jgi:hypothetical protein
MILFHVENMKKLELDPSFSGYFRDQSEFLKDKYGASVYK